MFIEDRVLEVTSTVVLPLSSSAEEPYRIPASTSSTKGSIRYRMNRFIVESAGGTDRPIHVLLRCYLYSVYRLVYTV